MTVAETSRSRNESRSRPIVTTPEYRRSRAALDDGRPETERVAAALESLAITRPLAAIAVPGTIVRVIRACRYGPYPALRLYYSVDAHAINLLWIESYDEMEP